jgi:type IV secretory pathway TraG/TraD family ATPase VirD4
LGSSNAYLIRFIKISHFCRFFQATPGSVSNGEGESIQETAADLIHINDIRELPPDEQFIFLHGVKPIRCKKVRYFEYPQFYGKYDPNPLEAKSYS